MMGAINAATGALAAEGFGHASGHDPLEIRPED
ncbi:MAG: hypothetical protein ACI8RZ_007837, partial [Myxococcota bacterium]